MKTDITKRLYEAGMPGYNLSSGDPLALEAYHKIIQLRNFLYVCIHGDKECNITDEGCAACITGKHPLVYVHKDVSV